MHKLFLKIAVTFLALGVVIGAFGAHGLKQVLPADSLAAFETGVRYQFYHAFALLATGILYERFQNRWTVYSGYAFITGIILFSGSLYALTLMKTTNTVGLNGIGVITPVGGLFFIAGWILLFVALNQKNLSTIKSI
jgi:uncharacterized membrane protein YgdD (TMEM256/DUF423 family)